MLSVFNMNIKSCVLPKVNFKLKQILQNWIGNKISNNQNIDYWLLTRAT